MGEGRGMCAFSSGGVSGATVGLGRQVGRSSRELARIIGGVAILPPPLFISI